MTWMLIDSTHVGLFHLRQYVAHLFLLDLCMFTSPPTLSVVRLMSTQISSFVFATCDIN